MSSRYSSKRSTRRSKSPDLVQGEQPGLRRIVQKKFLNDVFDAAAQKHPGWKVLIVDQQAMRVISSSIGMYDIMERKVTVVESLEKKRAPFPDMAAIYILENTPSSVGRMVDDFNTSKPLYGKAVFLYFLGHLDDELFGVIKNCPALVKRLKGLTEINIDFLTKEERAFSLDMRNDFANFYLRQGNSAELSIAQKLVTVCGTLNEYPHIRYNVDSANCHSLASLFKLKMDEFVGQNPNWWYHGGPKRNQAATKERGTLLLLDRADDPLTPLMHDFTYASMVHDLLPMEDDRITYDNDKGQKTDVLLDEKDAVWVDMRGKHIAAVIEQLSSRIRDIMNSSTGKVAATKSGDGNLSLSQMASALKALPEYQEVMSKLSQHMHLSHQCMDVFTAKRLMKVAEVEQTLATGKNEDGRSPKVSEIMDEAEDLLVRMKTPEEKLRLILVATISCNGLRSQDKRRLTSAAELSGRELRLLDALEVFGQSVVSDSDRKKTITGLPGRMADNSDESEYTSTRYVPLLKGILEEATRDELSLEDFPSVTPMPNPKPSSSARSKKSSGAASSARKKAGASSKWAGSDKTSKRSTGPTYFAGGRQIVFYMGGVCYSELRVAREIMEANNREIIIGSTAFLTPKEFVEDLGSLAEKSR